MHAGFTSCGQLVSGSEDHRIYVWDIQTGEVIQELEGHSESILSVDTHLKTNLIVSSGAYPDHTIKIWQMTDQVPAVLRPPPRKEIARVVVAEEDIMDIDGDYELDSEVQ